MITVADIMTSNPHTARPDSSLAEARQLLRSHGFRHLPVTDEQGQLLGIVSERNLLAAQESSQTKMSHEQRTEQELSIDLRQLMVEKVYTVSPQASVEDAARYLEEHKIGCLPVLEDRQLVGIITDTDFVGVAITLLELMREQEPL
ncbi:CBS domain-containing protein [Aliagarivorans taiwanensis]|uniref:CBS domain-containing protein n=1 Tax=Aliagarivorans taiwanensis TaxID=561966 RepID=UPI00041EE2FC|nr:CBS domain-containing protein [Aliagarivorans taiwanensis]